MSNSMFDKKPSFDMISKSLVISTISQGFLFRFLCNLRGIPGDYAPSNHFIATSLPRFFRFGSGDDLITESYHYLVCTGQRIAL